MVKREPEEEKGGAETPPDLRHIAQINTDFVNQPVPSTTEPSTSLVRVGTDACESKISSVLRYKDYDFHKNACPQ
ncbi:uncharacterized protein TNCV_322931 [Trichonephila clavipes]|nr:uncharacterized protein TNCV_322931 [Trichonephila clavipes]